MGMAARVLSLVRFYPTVKRGIDIAAATVLLCVFAGPALVVAALVRWRLGAPVLFAQRRPGLGGKPFSVLKFRTMSNAHDATGRLLPDEQRLGRFGSTLRRWSLDELPQIVNVLRGDMSFIGPRPLLMQYLPLYNDEQRRRMDVRPGITGWAQVRGRNNVSWDQRLCDDVYYVDHLGAAIDLRIAMLTIRKVVSGDGVSATDHATMEPFRGNILGSAMDNPTCLCEARDDSTQ